MMDRVAASLLARRALALAILALLLWMAAPLLSAPFDGFGARTEAIETETALLDRLGRMEARRASVASLATLGSPPFIVASDAGAAIEALQARLAGVALPDKLRIDGLSPLPRAETPGAPVEVSMSFSATESAFYDILLDLETRPPFVRVRDLSVKSSVEGNVRVIAGSMVVSAVPFLGTQP